jgi:hypothetical protein
VNAENHNLQSVYPTIKLAIIWILGGFIPEFVMRLDKAGKSVRQAYTLKHSPS